MVADSPHETEQARFLAFCHPHIRRFSRTAFRSQKWNESKRPRCEPPSQPLLNGQPSCNKDTCTHTDTLSNPYDRWPERKTGPYCKRGIFPTYVSPRQLRTSLGTRGKYQETFTKLLRNPRARDVQHVQNQFCCGAASTELCETRKRMLHIKLGLQKCNEALAHEHTLQLF